MTEQELTFEELEKSYRFLSELLAHAVNALGTLRVTDKSFDEGFATKVIEVIEVDGAIEVSLVDA